MVESLSFSVAVRDLANLASLWLNLGLSGVHSSTTMWVVFFPDARTPRRAATRLVPRSPQDLPHRLPLVRVRRTTSKTESTTSQKWKLEQVLQGRLNLSFQNKLKSSKISTPRNFGKYTICLLIRVLTLRHGKYFYANFEDETFSISNKKKEKK